jgi:RHS repeat-associated protein
MTTVSASAIDDAPRCPITDTYDYDAFGNEVNHTASTPNNYLYRAEQYDSDLGLYYLRARYYNSLTGRFLSRDPEVGTPRDPPSLHKYSYADGDPVNLLDPTGHDAGVEIALIWTTIRTVTVPAVSAIVGNYVTLQAIPWIASTLTLAAQAEALSELVATFAEDVGLTELAKGLMKLYVCGELATTYLDLTLDLDSLDVPAAEKKDVEVWADRLFILACSDYALRK